ncbi:MAG: hypothetical protein ABSF03_29995 [Streptosporangiaceae bacterium]
MTEWLPGFTEIVVPADSRPLSVTVTRALWPAPIDPEAGETESLPIRLEGIETV